MSWNRGRSAMWCRHPSTPFGADRPRTASGRSRYSSTSQRVATGCSDGTTACACLSLCWRCWWSPALGRERQRSWFLPSRSAPMARSPLWHSQDGASRVPHRGGPSLRRPRRWRHGPGRSHVMPWTPSSRRTAGWTPVRVSTESASPSNTPRIASQPFSQLYVCGPVSLRAMISSCVYGVEKDMLSIRSVMTVITISLTPSGSEGADSAEARGVKVNAQTEPPRTSGRLTRIASRTL